MDHERIVELKKQRDICIVLYKEDERKIIESLKEINFDEIYSCNLPMEISELLKFGENLDNEYESLNNIDDDHIGIPYDLVKAIENFQFKLFNFEKESEDYWGKKKDISYMATAKDNVKNEYYRSLDKITSFGIEIYDVKKMIANFKNRSMSSCCGDTKVYKFYCKRKYYKFIIEFIDDCDCEPGLLYVDNIIDDRTGKKIEIKCDLYCQNTGSYELNNFLTLIESESLEDFVNKRYTKLLLLFDYFEKYSIKINDVDRAQLIDYNALLDNHNYLSFRISTPRGECIILLPHYNENGETCDYIFVGPTVTDYNNNKAKSFMKLIENKNDKGETGSVKIDRTYFYHGYKECCLYTKFDDSTSVENIIELINCHFNNTEGKVGYEENGTYYTSETIKLYLKSRSISFKDYTDYYNGPIIGVVIYLSSLSWDYYDGLNFRQNKDLYNINYPYDMYKLVFWFDKADKNCHLSIEGKYKLINKLSEKYYSTKTLDVIEEFKVFEPLEITGTFTEVFNSLKDIIVKIQKIFEK